MLAKGLGIYNALFAHLLRASLRAQFWGVPVAVVGFGGVPAAIPPPVSSAANRQQIESLYWPGSGVLPPVLAGREAESAVLDAFRRKLLSGAPIPRDVIIYGPRGNGKTVLIESFRRVCADQGVPDHRFIDTYASSLSSLDSLLQALLPSGAGRGLARRLKDAKSVQALSVQVALGDPKAPTVAEALTARVAEGPLAMAVDEAHMLTAEVGRELLNASQAVRKRGLPFLLLLAGTPDLRARMRAMGATFWGRSERMPVGRLSRAAAHRALVEPLARFGVAFEEEALDLALADIVDYPYFVQLWGESLTSTKTDAPRGAPVTVDDAKRASSVFALKRDDYYRDRYEELREGGLLGVATAVARRAQRSPSVTREDLAKVVSAELCRAQGLGSQARHPATEEVCERLIEVGYVWWGTGELEAGIPSLMNYVLKRD